MSFGMVGRAWELQHGDVSAVDKLVLMGMASHAHDVDHIAFPSVKSLAARCNVSTRTVQRSIQQLLKLDLIELVEDLPPSVERRCSGYKMPNAYRLLLTGDKLSPHDMGVADGVTPVSPTGDMGVTQIEKEPITESGKESLATFEPKKDSGLSMPSASEAIAEIRDVHFRKPPAT